LQIGIEREMGNGEMTGRNKWKPMLFRRLADPMTREPPTSHEAVAVTIENTSVMDHKLQASPLFEGSSLEKDPATLMFVSDVTAASDSLRKVGGGRMVNSCDSRHPVSNRVADGRWPTVGQWPRGGWPVAHKAFSEVRGGLGPRRLDGQGREAAEAVELLEGCISVLGTATKGVTRRVMRASPEGAERGASWTVHDACSGCAKWQGRVLVRSGGTRARSGARLLAERAMAVPGKFYRR
jgi:hypothetical protein